MIIVQSARTFTFNHLYYITVIVKYKLFNIFYQLWNNKIISCNVIYNSICIDFVFILISYYSQTVVSVLSVMGVSWLSSSSLLGSWRSSSKLILPALYQTTMSTKKAHIIKSPVTPEMNTNANILFDENNIGTSGDADF